MKRERLPAACASVLEVLYFILSITFYIFSFILLFDLIVFRPFSIIFFIFNLFVFIVFLFNYFQCVLPHDIFVTFSSVLIIWDVRAYFAHLYAISNYYTNCV